jgi:hypothetical protein
VQSEKPPIWIGESPTLPALTEFQRFSTFLPAVGNGNSWFGVGDG